MPKNNSQFLTDLYADLTNLDDEISERNADIEERDEYIYEDKLEESIDIPIGHDFTPVNWLKRTVEIHKTMFMGRPFQAVSTYDTKDISTASDDQERQRLEIENKREKTLSEERRKLVDNIIADNGGHALFLDGAESASAVGNWVVKTYYSKDEDKYVITPVEAVENCYALWSSDNFREFDAFVYAFQVNKAKAARDYGLNEEELMTAPKGSPFLIEEDKISDMVTVVEVTGFVPGWSTANGKLKQVSVGKETAFNAVFVGGKQVRLLDKQNELPRYYIFPNKRERRRAWGRSDITDAAININATYIETLSDWRTVASKVNFPKFKGFNFGPDTTMPKIKPRKIEMLPLGEGQDLALLQTGDANGLDFGRQLDELKEQFVRETGISRVLFDDPSVTLNSNQALLTSMKPTSDLAENKKQVWAPILSQMFTDAINIVATHKKEYAELAKGDWKLKIQWPSVMQKEDPVYQQMLLNRWNAGTLSMQTFLEMQGETKEEIDRIRDEFYDPITASALGKQFPALAQFVMGLPGNQQELGGGQQATVAQNQPGQGVASQPGSGATTTSPQGALNQTNQQQGG